MCLCILCVCVHGRKATLAVVCMGVSSVTIVRMWASKAQKHSLFDCARACVSVYCRGVLLSHVSVCMQTNYDLLHSIFTEKIRKCNRSFRSISPSIDKLHQYNRSMDWQNCTQIDKSIFLLIDEWDYHRFILVIERFFGSICLHRLMK